MDLKLNKQPVRLKWGKCAHIYVSRLKAVQLHSGGGDGGPTDRHIQSVTVIQPRGCKGVNYRLKVLPGENWLYFGQLPQMEEASFDNSLNLTVKVKLRIHFKPKVCDIRFNILGQGAQIYGGSQRRQKPSLLSFYR